MRWLRAGGESEMVALFLRGELASAHYGDQIRTLLATSP